MIPEERDIQFDHGEFAKQVVTALGMDGERVLRILIDIRPSAPIVATVWKLVDQRINDVDWSRSLADADLTIEQYRASEARNALATIHFQIEALQRSIADLQGKDSYEDPKQASVSNL